MTAARIDPDFLSPSNPDGSAEDLPAFYAEVIAAINEHADDLDDGGGGPEISVLQYGAVGDGVTDDSVAIQSAVTAAQTLNRPLRFPSGYTFLVSNQGSYRAISVTGNNVRLYGHGATIKFDSIIDGTGNALAAIYASGGISRLIIEGLKFQGSTSSDDGQSGAIGTQGGQAIYCAADVDFTRVRDCEFDHCQPGFWVSSEDSAALVWRENVMIDTALPLSPPRSSIVVNNHWKNTAVVTTRSHCMYVFGRAERFICANNFFENTTDGTIEIRANDAYRLQKREWVIVGNTFNNSDSYGMFISDLASSIEIGSLVVANNTFTNVGGPMQLLGVRDAVISGNVMVWDYQYAYALNNQGVALGSNMSTGENAAAGVLIANNRAINRHPFWAQATIASQPANGDTITVGSTVYTWKTTPAVAGDIQRSASVDTCAAALVGALRGTDGRNSYNTVLREVSDAWCSQNSSEGKVWIASRSTFVFSRTGTAVTVSSVTDASTALQYGVNVSNSANVKIIGNTITGGGIALTSNIDPIVEDNTLILNSSQPAVIDSFGNTFPKFDGNSLRWDQTVAVPEAQGDRWLNSYDAFPVIRDSEVLTLQNGGSVGATLPWMTGVSGFVPVGDGKAKQIFYYGREVYTDQNSARWYHWNDGDQVGLNDQPTGTWYFFTFKRTAPNAGLLEFNSYAGLMALINGSTAGKWTASNPVAAYYGADAQAYGYMEIKASVTGTARNGDVLLISRASRTCGVYLRSWVNGGMYANKSQTQFFGGAAAATQTVIFTPLASLQSPLIVSGYDAASHALDPISYAADTVPGVAYVITHAAAAGTEKFFWKVA